MPIAVHTLAVGEEPLRQDKMQTVLGPCHGDVEQPAFLLDFRRCSAAEIGGNAAVNDIQHEDGFPLLSFGGMNRREDQIVLIQHRHPCLIARGIRRVERQLGQEARPRRIACGNLLELQQVGLANGRIFMNAFEMRLIPARACPISAGQPALPERMVWSVLTNASQPSPDRGGAGISDSAPSGSGRSVMTSRTRALTTVLRPAAIA